MVQNTDAAPQNTSSANNPVNARQVSQEDPQEDDLPF